MLQVGPGIAVGIADQQGHVAARDPCEDLARLLRQIESPDLHDPADHPPLGRGTHSVANDNAARRTCWYAAPSMTSTTATSKALTNNGSFRSIDQFHGNRVKRACFVGAERGTARRSLPSLYAPAPRP